MKSFFHPFKEDVCSSDSISMNYRLSCEYCSITLNPSCSRTSSLFLPGFQVLFILFSITSYIFYISQVNINKPVEIRINVAGTLKKTEAASSVHSSLPPLEQILSSLQSAVNSDIFYLLIIITD